MDGSRYQTTLFSKRSSLFCVGKCDGSPKAKVPNDYKYHDDWENEVSISA